MQNHNIVNMKRRLTSKKDFQLLMLALPVIIHMFLFQYLPIFGMTLAFKDYRYDLGIFGSEWNGWDNFRFFFESEAAFRVTFHTLAYNLTFIVLGTVVNVTVALLLNEIRKKWAIKYFQTTMFFPYFMSWVVVAFVVYALLSPAYGMVNDVVAYFGGEKINYYHNVLESMPLYMGYDNMIYTPLDEEIETRDNIVNSRAVEWMEKGFFHPDAAMGNTSMEEEKAAGRIFLISDVNKPGVEADMLQRYGYEVYAVPLGQSTISTGSITSNMTCVSRTSQNPERAVMLLELMNTNKELYNTIVFGLEGQHYEMRGEDRIEVTNADGYSGFAWMMGCQFNAYKLPAQKDDVWELTMQLNDEAMSSPDLGFYFDDDSVKTEVANITAVWQEYKDILHYGVVSDYESMLAERNEKLKQAGIELVAATMQEQIDNWK